jgi:NitT/TauT family transport system permease protein
LAPPALFATLLLGAWWGSTVVFELRPFILPSPPQVAAVFTEQGSYLYRSTRTTMTEAAVGYGLAATIGLGVGALLASWPPLARATLPTLVGLDAIPKLALAPLLVVWLGFGPAPKIVIVVLTCLLPVVLATVSGLTSTPTDQVELIRSLRASWWKTLRKVRFPFALPRIFVGLKIAAPLAVIGAVIGEFFGATAGLGYAIRAAGSDTALVYAALALLAAMSVGLFYLVAAVERLAAPWARAVNA